MIWVGLGREFGRKGRSNMDLGVIFFLIRVWVWLVFGWLESEWEYWVRVVLVSRYIGLVFKDLVICDFIFSVFRVFFLLFIYGMYCNRSCDVCFIFFFRFREFFEGRFL